MKKTPYILLAFAVLLSLQLRSQTPAGKSWYIDYELWNENTPALHILCGNDPSLNPGDELTLEMWVRAYTFGENRKVLGKIDSQGDSFDNGYVMGFQNLNVYTEIWNPSLQVIPYGSPGPIAVDSGFVHMATTYSAHSGYMRDYINGILVGEVQIFPSNPIAANDAEFMIGAAPWDPYAFQFYGALDEVRVWNVARTQSQIQEFMFKQLNGDEAGLVAYYNFNTAYDNVVPDMSGNNHTGILQNASDHSWSWAPSHAPVGDLSMYHMLNPVAAWSGKMGNEFNYAITESGLSLIADIGKKEFEKFILFAHTDAHGTTSAYAPDGPHTDFARTHREWYLIQSENPVKSVFFNLGQAAGNGEALPQVQDTEKYALLYRPHPEALFAPIAFPNQVYTDNLIFNDLILSNGYYALGYSSSSFDLQVSVHENPHMHSKVYPNPAHDYIILSHTPHAKVTLYNLQGKILMETYTQSDYEHVTLPELSAGIYMLTIQQPHVSTTHKLVIQN